MSSLLPHAYCNKHGPGEADSSIFYDSIYPGNKRSRVERVNLNIRYFFTVSPRKKGQRSDIGGKRKKRKGGKWKIYIFQWVDKFRLILASSTVRRKVRASTMCARTYRKKILCLLTRKAATLDEEEKDHVWKQCPTKWRRHLSLIGWRALNFFLPLENRTIVRWMDPGGGEGFSFLSSEAEETKIPANQK